MKQYNRLMLGEHGKYLPECMDGGFIGINFLSDLDLTDTATEDEAFWRKHMIDVFLQKFPEKSIGTARNSVGFLWTVCFGLKIGDIVLASNGEGVYKVGERDLQTKKSLYHIAPTTTYLYNIYSQCIG